MLQVSETVSNEVFQGYTKFALQFADSNVSFRITIQSVEIGGFPYPYLLCRLPNNECVTINLVQDILLINIQNREVEYLIKQRHGGSCILFCS